MAEKRVDTSLIFDKHQSQSIGLDPPVLFEPSEEGDDEGILLIIFIIFVRLN
jgi:hypothetical protein